jgi:hypothetical protein
VKDAEFDADPGGVQGGADLLPTVLVHVHGSGVGTAGGQGGPAGDEFRAPHGIRLDPGAGGDADLHARHGGPNDGDGGGHFGPGEDLLARGVTRMHVQRGHAEFGDGRGVGGQLLGRDRQRGMRPPLAIPVQTGLQHPSTVPCRRRNGNGTDSFDRAKTVGVGAQRLGLSMAPPVRSERPGRGLGTKRGEVMRGQHRVVHPEAALAVSAGITGITFAAVVAVMAVQHASEQATDVRNAGQTPAPTPTTTSATPTPQPPTTIIVQQPAPQTKVLVVTKEVPAPQSTDATLRSTPQPRDLLPSTTTRDAYGQLMTEWPSMAGNVFDLFVR